MVLLADVLPSFITKLVAPYFIHKIPYYVRIWIFAALSAGGMVVIAVTPASRDGGVIGAKMVGVMMASLSSGAGELSFLGLTHYYGHFSLAAWGSGTGGAGLVGAGAYVVATTTLGLSSRTSLIAFSFLPIIMLLSFFVILPRGPLKLASGKQAEYQNLAAEEETEDENEREVEEQGLLSDSVHSNATSAKSHKSGRLQHLQANLKRARSLFFP